MGTGVGVGMSSSSYSSTGFLRIPRERGIGNVSYKLPFICFLILRMDVIIFFRSVFFTPLPRDFPRGFLRDDGTARRLLLPRSDRVLESLLLLEEQMEDESEESQLVSVWVSDSESDSDSGSESCEVFCFFLLDCLGTSFLTLSSLGFSSCLLSPPFR